MAELCGRRWRAARDGGGLGGDGLDGNGDGGAWLGSGGVGSVAADLAVVRAVAGLAAPVAPGRQRVGRRALRHEEGLDRAAVDMY